MKAVKGGSRLWETILVERITIRFKNSAELIREAEERVAKAKKLIEKSKLLKRNRTA